MAREELSTETTDSTFQQVCCKGKSVGGVVSSDSFFKRLVQFLYGYGNNLIRRQKIGAEGEMEFFRKTSLSSQDRMEWDSMHTSGAVGF